MAEKVGFVKETIVYFEAPGQQNTQDTLDLALERALARGIKKVVIASTRGETALLAAKVFADTGIKLIIVPHQYGFLRDGQRFPEELIPALEKQGHRVYFGTMLFHTDDLYGSRVPSRPGDDAPHLLPGDEGGLRDTADGRKWRLCRCR